MSTPKDFKVYPWSSVFSNSESETIALNIITILSRTDNRWRKLSWEEYKSERLKDGHFSEREKSFFDKVIGYTTSSETARLFSPTWKEIK